MIAYIQGNLTFKSPTYVIIETNGMGYEVNISLNTYDKIVNLEEGQLYTHLAIKEDAHTLYGFFEAEEKKLFRHLISVSGIGPNSARMILSSVAHAELRKAIIAGDVSLLKSIKGIGAKSGQRIVVELQDVLKKQYEDDSVPGAAQPTPDRELEEAREGLVGLGFKKEEAEKALKKISMEHGQNLSTEALIKHALKIL